MWTENSQIVKLDLGRGIRDQIANNCWIIEKARKFQKKKTSTSALLTTLSIKELTLWTVVLEKTLEGPLDSKIKPVSPKGNQPWIFIGRTDAEAGAPILWLPDARSLLVGKDWGQEEKGSTESEMVWWHHQINGHEFKQTPGVGEGQGSQASCSS